MTDVREDLKNEYAELKQLVTDCEADLLKLADRNNKAAGRRLRATMQKAKKGAQEVRAITMALINSIE